MGIISRPRRGPGVQEALVRPVQNTTAPALETTLSNAVGFIAMNAR